MYRRARQLRAHLLARTQRICDRGCERTITGPGLGRRRRRGSGGASSKQAAPLVYGLDRLDERSSRKAPIVLVPEVSTLAQGSFWAKEPAGQYAEPARLGRLVADCCKHLACLHRPDGAPYLTEGFPKRGGAAGHDRLPVPALERVYLCGHSGAGLPWRKPPGRH